MQVNTPFIYSYTLQVLKLKNVQKQFRLSQKWTEVLSIQKQTAKLTLLSEDQTS